MDMYINGGWVSAPEVTTITSPYSGDVIDTIPSATMEQVEQTLQAAVRAATTMSALTGYEFAKILNKQLHYWKRK